MPVPQYAHQREIQERIDRLERMRGELLVTLDRLTQSALRDTGLNADEWRYLTWDQREAWLRAYGNVGALRWAELTRDQRVLRVVIELERNTK